MKGLTLRDLEAVRLLAIRRNFRAAASELGVSAPTLSHMIASLEERLGIRLFNRTTRSVAPTEAGEALISRTDPALSAIAEAFEVIEGLRNTASGRLRLNASEVAVTRLLPAIARFMTAFPQVEVELASDGLLSDIVADGFDAGIRLEEAVPQDMVAVPLSREEQIIVVAAPAYLASRPAPKTPDDLKEHECIVARLPSGRPMAWEFEEDGRAFNAAVSGRIQVGSVALALQAAQLGLGIAYVGLSDAMPGLAGNSLVQLLEAWTPPFPGLRLYYPRQRHHSAAFKAFLGFLRDEKVAV
ncbi:LysR family transcriptional regulator [Novosphingobium kaempferiae]|uniref:LysR family transcriptional regulator n=1 Tax=Novosphingobium kaempferiae TaxID=2896849 RepID=UPI001E5875D2|nr:LysR family transcriptional regulator [Novosphingobium kaempferiae]